MGDILVVGSMNMDLVVKSDIYPKRGETIIGNDFTMLPGGKGANQAVTIGTLGGKVSFISACGNDQYGEQLLNNLENNNVNIKNIFKIDNISTGIASIIVEKNGANRIIVVPGAYGKLSPKIINQISDEIKKAKVILIQMEIPFETVLYTIDLAHDFGTKVVFDPAPAKKLPKEYFKKIDYILPNDGELGLLLKDYNLNSRQEKIDKLLDLGVGVVIVTEGENGVSYYTEDNFRKFEGLKVNVVDTTGAGDAFAGAFTYGLEQNWDIEKIIKFSIRVSAISVTKMGAQTSLPNLEEVNNFSNQIL